MQLNWFAEDNQLDKLSKLGDPLEKLNVVNFETFRPVLKDALEKERKSNAGRPPFDYVMMFKIIVLMTIYNLSYDQIEYQITDRLSFQRFLGISLGDKVPDAKTIWLFNELLRQSGALSVVFAMFNSYLETMGIITHKGTIIDATFVDAPKQRNTKDENDSIKEGETPEEWAENPHKLAQKDVDARWAVKGKETHYGYKNHVKVDAESKIILDHRTTPASVHDSNVCTEMVDENDQELYADSAYASREIAERLPKHVKNNIHEKGYRDNPLTKEQKESNRIKSKTRCRIEHVFGFMTVAMHGITLRSIGIERADFHNGLTNLVYNFFRYSIIQRRKLAMG